MSEFCPKCDREMIARNGRGRKFWGCPAYFPKSPRNPEGFDEDKGEKQCTGNKPMKFTKTVIVRQERRSIVGSEQQIAIWDEMEHGTAHLMVKALAGTGKTTTMEHGAYRLKGTMRAMAFNVKIKNELAARMPESCQVSTFHSLGFQILKSVYGKAVDINTNKTYNIIDAGQWLSPNLEEGEAFAIKIAVRKLVALCKNRLLEPTDENLTALVDRYNIDLSDPELIFEIVPKVLKRAKEMTSMIDYEDQLWLPVVLNLPFPKVDNLIVDEVQDTNPVRTEMAFRCLSPNGRMFVIGDENQAIMGFTGSDTEAIENLECRLGSTARGLTVLPLTKTRRCPHTHVEVARAMVPDFEAFPDAPQGSINNFGFNEALEQIAEGDMVQCRNNAPLAGLCWKLLRRQLKVQIAGKNDFAEGLKSLIKRMRAKDMVSLIEKIEKYRNAELEKCGKRRNAEAAAETVNDKCDTIIALADGVNDVDELLGLMDTIFADVDNSGQPKAAVLLTTSHKAKGLEADTVWVLGPELYPARWAKMPWEIKQEHNLIFVRDTRSKDILNYMPLPEGKSAAAKRQQREAAIDLEAEAEVMELEAEMS